MEWYVEIVRNCGIPRREWRRFASEAEAHAFVPPRGAWVASIVPQGEVVIKGTGYVPRAGFYSGDTEAQILGKSQW